jgi:hypothetical protein
MNNNVRKYIDSLIRDHVENNSINYELSIHDLSKHEKESFMDFIYDHDKHFQDIVHEYLDELIYERIGFVNSEDNYNRGLKPVNDPINGEIEWVRS